MQKITRLLLQKKWWIIATVAVVAASIYGYQAYQTANAPAPAGRPHTVELGNIIAIVSATGTLSPVNSVRCQLKNHRADH